MTHHLDLVAENLLVGLEKSIHFRVGRKTEVVVIDSVETVDGVVDDLIELLVVALHDLLSVPSLCIVELRSDVDVVEEIECGADGYVVLHTVSPVLDKAGLQDLVFLGGYAVADVSSVFDGYLLVPSFLSRQLLFLEGIELREGDAQVGQGERQDRVLHVLRDIETGGDGQAYLGKSSRITD